MAAKGVLRTLEGGLVGFNCPGCKYLHVLRIEPKDNQPCWGFNGNYDKPTFTPSVLVTCGHYVLGYGKGSGAYCQFGCDDPTDGNPACCSICHSYVTDGNIQFLNDSTHELAGQTVPLTAKG